MKLSYFGGIFVLIDAEPFLSPEILRSARKISLILYHYTFTLNSIKIISVFSTTLTICQSEAGGDNKHGEIMDIDFVSYPGCTRLCNCSRFSSKTIDSSEAGPFIMSPVRYGKITEIIKPKAKILAFSCA